MPPPLRAEYNLIVLGGPDDNVWTARVASRTSDVPRAPACSLCVVTHPDVVFRTGSKSLTPFALGGTLYEQPGTGIVFTAPLWGGDRTPRMALVVAGTDMDGFRLAMQLVRRHESVRCGHGGHAPATIVLHARDHHAPASWPVCFVARTGGSDHSPDDACALLQPRP